ncbi:MAG: DedA family protein [Candidatus Falkowbacteria bacterium]
MPDINLLFSLLTKFAWLGNWLFFVLAFIESAPFIGLFIPGATLISVGGFLASQGFLNPWDLIIFSAVGAICGDFFSYSLGLWGSDFIKNKKLINIKLLHHGENFFKKYGDKSIFLGRFFGPIRAIIPFVAGLSRMKRKPFIFWNVLSGIGWAALNVFLGYFSGTLLGPIFKKWSGRLSLTLLIVLSTIALIYWLIKKHGESVIAYFHSTSQKFLNYLQTKNWFNQLKNRYLFMAVFFEESKYAAEKIFGGLLVFLFLSVAYLLMLIFDVF